MLRHYHELGLLEPVDVDVDNGYRRYAPEQIVTAQVIRRFRDLDMPLEDIQIVLSAPDVETATGDRQPRGASRVQPCSDPANSRIPARPLSNPTENPTDSIPRSD